MSTFKNLVKTTDSRSEFNRVYKRYLEHSGKIRCDRCIYHGGENNTNKRYGKNYYNDMKICFGEGNETKIRYPNWKLVSKNCKQWMKKPTIIKTKYYGGYQYIRLDITW